MTGNAKNSIQTFGLKQALTYLDKNPEKNIPKLLTFVEKADANRTLKNQCRALARIAEDENSNWYKLIKSFWTDIDQNVRRTFFQNFVVNASVIGNRRQQKSREKHGCNIPWAIVMDPTSACNLKCVGSWSSAYGDKLSMDFSALDKIVSEGRELGIFLYFYSGGEPLLRKNDLLNLCRKHPDCLFLAFTNGTLIDKKFANEILKVRNFIPVISVEGFEKETDLHRGAGTYLATVRAMEILRGKKLIFGFSSCYHALNTEVIGSEAFFDDMIKKGAKFGWFFTYMPVGQGAKSELLTTAKQREFMYRQIRRFRETKPLFTVDFCNDAEYVGGCIAGGRSYLHINANGDIEPCAFIHYSDSNIHHKTLLEACKSPLFMQYRSSQPFNKNHLCPCPLLDNPEKLPEMVEKSGACSTDLSRPEDVYDLSAKCLKAAESWELTADRLWHKSVAASAYSKSVLSKIYSYEKFVRFL